MKDKKVVKVKRRPIFWYSLIVAALVVVGVSSYTQAGTSRPLRYYTDSGNTALTYFTNGSGENVSYWGINTDNPLCELDINGTICVNRTGFYYNGVNLTPSADGNNYPTSLSVNQTNGNYTINLGRNGLSTLQASFSVNSTGAGGSGNVSASGGVSGWPTKFNTATDLTILNLSCAPGGALSTLSNDSICTNFVQSEVDPVWSAASTNYYTKTELDVNNASVWAGINSKGNGNASANNSVNNIPVHTGGGNLTSSTLFYDPSIQEIYGTTNLTIQDSEFGWTRRGQLSIIDSAGNPGLALIRSNTSYVIFGMPGGTPFAAPISYSGTNSQYWFSASQAQTTLSAGDTTFGSDRLNPRVFIDADRGSLCINCNTTTANLTVNGNATITGPVGINVTNPNATLDVNGNLSVNGNIVVRLGNGQVAQLNDGTLASAVWGTSIGLISEEGVARIATSNQNITFHSGATRNSMTQGSNFLGQITQEGWCVNCSDSNSTLEVTGNLTITDNKNLGGISIFNTFAGRSTSLLIHRPSVGGLFLTTSGGSPAYAQIGATSSSLTTSTPISIGTGTHQNFSHGDVSIGSFVGGGLFVAANRSQIGINTLNPNSTLHVVGTGNFTSYLQADNISSRVVCVGGDCRTDWPAAGGGNSTLEIQNAVNNSGLYNISISCSNITGAVSNLCTLTSGPGGSGGGNVTANMSDKWIPYAFNNTEIRDSPVFFDTQINGFNFSQSNITLGSNGKLFTGGLVCNDFGTCPYIGQSPSFIERLYFYSSDFIEFEADGFLLPRQYNEFRSFNAGVAGVNITNTGGGKGNLWVSNDSYTYGTAYVEVLNNSGYAIEPGNKKYFTPIISEYMGSLLVQGAPFSTVVTASGTFASNFGNYSHPGIFTFSDSTTAHGGVHSSLGVDSLLLSGTENHTTVFMVQPTGSAVGRSSTVLWSGFHDQLTNRIPVDGCVIVLNNTDSGNNGYGLCTSNSATTFSSSNFTFTNATWYSANVDVRTSSSVYMELRTESGAMVWNCNITTNIPTAHGRQTGALFSAYENSTGAAAVRAYLDYQSLMISRELTR